MTGAFMKDEDIQTEDVRSMVLDLTDFMSAVAGNLPNFEEATRALFAGDQARFAAMTAAWITIASTPLGLVPTEESSCFLTLCQIATRAP